MGTIKRLFLLLLLIAYSACVTACAPVLSAKTMERASRSVPLDRMIQQPELYRGKLYVFGGTIASSKTTAAGSLLELVFTTVDSYGSLQNTISGSRVLVFMPKEQGFLDPVLFAPGRNVTVSGFFDGVQNGKIGEMSYTFPFFIIAEIYLWPKESPRTYYYDSYYSPSHWWGPSWGIGGGWSWH
jgi:outer membrane lipoprotein